MNKKQVAAKLFFFKDYWRSDLCVRLDNAEMLAGYPRASECKNPLLGKLISEFITSQINIVLLKVYETVQLIKELEGSYNPVSSIQNLLDYRNKLLTHREMNGHKEKWQDTQKSLLSEKGKIYRNVREGITDLLKKIDGMNISPEISGSIPVQKKILEKDIDELFDVVHRKA